MVITNDEDLRESGDIREDGDVLGVTSTGDDSGSSSNGESGDDEESGILIDNEELINEIAKSAIGGVTVAFLTKKFLDLE